MTKTYQGTSFPKALPNPSIFAWAATIAMTASAAQVVARSVLEFPEPIVRRIEYYGLRSISQITVEQVVEGAGLHVGVDLREFDPRLMIKQIESLSGVRQATISPIFGSLLEDDASGLVVYIGVAEEGTPKINIREAPDGDVEVPKEIMEAAQREEEAFMAAAAEGKFSEDSSQGHSLSEDSELRAAQERYVDLANRCWDVLVDVLNNSRNGRHRAVAAKVIAYTDDKQLAAATLVPTLNDPDKIVRNNGVRALSLIYRHANSQSELSIPAPPALIDQLIDMLHSADWTDRNKATSLLLALDDDSEVVDALRDRAIPSLAEMARWQTSHGLMAFLLLAKLDGTTHDKARQLWELGQQETVITRMNRETHSGAQFAPDS